MPPIFTEPETAFSGATPATHAASAAPKPGQTLLIGEYLVGESDLTDLFGHPDIRY